MLSLRSLLIIAVLVMSGLPAVASTENTENTDHCPTLNAIDADQQ